MTTILPATVGSTSRRVATALAGVVVALTVVHFAAGHRHRTLA